MAVYSTQCNFQGCNNKRRNRGNGFLHPLCEKHHRLKYPRKNKKKHLLNKLGRFKERFRGVPCQDCGWNLAPCDVHRIIPGKQGGKYTTDNVIVLCPNCHRIKHNL